MSECLCGRRSATAAEHAQALEEYRRHGDDPNDTVYMRPLWMTSVCFARARGIPCKLKRLWGSERYIEAARTTFRRYMAERSPFVEVDGDFFGLRSDAE